MGGDADGYFTIDPGSGAIRTAAPLDHEAHQSVLLTVQAAADTSSAAYTQVRAPRSFNIKVPRVSSAIVMLRTLSQDEFWTRVSLDPISRRSISTVALGIIIPTLE